MTSVHRLVRLATWLALAATVALPAAAQGVDDGVLQAREALRVKDRARLLGARDVAVAAAHPLASWTAYWELTNRLGTAQQAELDTFYARWPATYVEDRLRNDWLLELGQRRDWVNFRVEFPRFRMNDDREVTCYALLTQHLDGQDVRAAARAAWWAQRDADDGCALLGRTLVEARVLGLDDAWQAARLAVEFNRPRAARAAATLVSPAAGASVADLFKDPARFLKTPPAGADTAELVTLALMRLAASDPDAAVKLLEAGAARRLSSAQASTAWAHVGKQAALKRLPQAADWSAAAWQRAAQAGAAAPAWSDDLLAWHVRAALQQPASDAERWALVLRATAAMSATEQRDGAWVYWRARAQLAQARPGAEGDTARAAARAALGVLSGQLSFYGKLATEHLGGRVALPPPPTPLSAAERDAPRTHAGLARALRLIDIGLRNEGVREWNFSLRGMGDRELLAAAQWACEREVWDRCINTSDRTRGEVDMAQRFPTPFRDQVLARAREIGVDPAFMYGLIRQESRFIVDARSTVGASGLMQVMPATARWTANKIGLVNFTADQINDRDTNIAIGTGYLKLVLDDFGGSMPLAAAAYNAGPGRPRSWRNGPPLEAAIWAENVPFAETRDYVKKVLSNTTNYAALLTGQPQSLKKRLGMVGPRDGGATEVNTDLP